MEKLDVLCDKVYENIYRATRQELDELYDEFNKEHPLNKLTIPAFEIEAEKKHAKKLEEEEIEFIEL